MKKVLLIFAVVTMVITGCSTSDDNDDDSGFNSDIQINPPGWIQGKWLWTTVQPENGFSFTSNDFLRIDVGVSTSQRGQLQAFSDNGQDVSASDTFTDDSYSVTINSIGGQSITYSFTRISNNQITWDQQPSIPTLTKQ